MIVGVATSFSVLFFYSWYVHRPRTVDRSWSLSPGAELPKSPSARERRRIARRSGRPTPVLVVDLGFKVSSQRGFVMDRSTGGVRLALPTQVSNGTVIQVRPTNAPEDIPWVSAVVRNGRHIGDYYEVGCEFEKTPQWRELAQLG